MNISFNPEFPTFNRSPKFIRLIEHIRQCIHDHEKTKEYEQIKNYSIIHHAEHIKRCIQDSPLIGRALFQFYHIVKNFHTQSQRSSSTLVLDPNESKTSIETKPSVDNASSITDQVESRVDLSKVKSSLSHSSLGNSLPTTKSITHFLQPTGSPHKLGGLLTKSILVALNKAPRYRTTQDIEILQHLLHRSETLRHLSTNVLQYAGYSTKQIIQFDVYFILLYNVARSLLLLTYPANTILTRQNDPCLLIYVVVYGECILLLETNQTTICGHRLNTGDIYGDEFLHSQMQYHLNGLVTHELSHCNLLGFFSRDIKAYEYYLSDIMKQSLLEQMQTQTIFSTMLWRNDILNYFMKYARYKQYSVDEIIYGNDENEHENINFILNGQISFICLISFPAILIRHPEYRQLPNFNDAKNKLSQENERTKWRFLEIFVLSRGHYFGFEPATTHSWYLSRSTVDVISIHKNHFKELGHFAVMILEKLRQDFLDILPNEASIRHSYIKYLQVNKSNQDSISIIQMNYHKKQSYTNNHNIESLQKIKWIPEQIILSRKK